MKILRILFTIWAMLVFHVFLIILLPFILIPALTNWYPIISYRAIRLWSWLFCLFCGYRYIIEGKENIEKKQSYIYVSNHTSFLDSPALPFLIPGVFKPLAKIELTRIPLFGWVVKAVCVSVDRSNEESRKRSLQDLRNRIQKGTSILIFPEGTMNRTKEVLQPFYSGAFRLAINTQTPICPIVISGANKLMKPSSFFLWPGKIKARILPPVSVEGKTLQDIDALKRKMHDTMREAIEKDTASLEK